MQNYLFTQGTQGPVNINLLQSTPVVHPLVSRISALPMAFQLSPIIHHNSPDYENSDALDINNTPAKNSSKNKISGERLFSSDSLCISDTNAPIEPSTWIGGEQTYSSFFSFSNRFRIVSNNMYSLKQEHLVFKALSNIFYFSTSITEMIP